MNAKAEKLPKSQFKSQILWSGENKTLEVLLHNLMALKGRVG
ncbi:MAG: hypothetical protein ABIY50_11990 [Ignavibacteria bacterium]